MGRLDELLEQGGKLGWHARSTGADGGEIGLPITALSYGHVPRALFPSRVA